MSSGLSKAAAITSAFALAACGGSLFGRGTSYAPGEGPGGDIPAEKLQRALAPPHDATEYDLHGQTVKDPFRPLESLDAPETMAWRERENRQFDDYIAPVEATRSHVLQFLESARPPRAEDSLPERHGDKYFFRRRAMDRRSFMVADSPRPGAPARALLDPLAIDPSGRTNVGGPNREDPDEVSTPSVSPDGKTVAYTLNAAGSDVGTVLFMDVGTGRNLDLAYSRVQVPSVDLAWDLDSRGFSYNAPKSETSKNYHFMHHVMGTPASADTEVRGGPAHVYRIGEGGQPDAYEWLSIATSGEGNALLYRRAGSDDGFKKISPSEGARLEPVRDAGGEVYAITDDGAPHRKLVKFSLDDAAPGKWRTVIPESADRLDSAFSLNGRLIVTYQHGGAEALKVFNLQGDRLPDPALPQDSDYTLHFTAPKPDSVLVSVTSYREMGAVYQYDTTTGAVSLFKASDHRVDLKEAVVENMFAVSKDGTKVPMTVIREPGTAVDGSAAALLYGYGGFDTVQHANFDDSIAAWVKAGGVYAVATLRGDGNFGRPWHQDGRLENKQHTFDDMAACAQALIQGNYTSPRRLALEGFSNGGLLAMTVGLQATGLFGAIVAEYPVTDMYRFPVGSYYGADWEREYGDPGVSADFNVLAQYSPLHNVPEGFRHPPVLLVTDVHDDRVLPWHSYKMAATLQVKEDPSSVTLLRTHDGNGHSSGGGSLKMWRENAADVQAFLVRTLGPLDQKAYKAQAAKNDNVASAAQPRRRPGPG